MGFETKLDRGKDLTEISFIGDIDEDSEAILLSLIDKIDGDSIFDMSKVISVNSCGVRSWINFIREVDKKGKIILKNCSQAVVSQINMIPNFRGDASVESVYCRYICEECDLYKDVLFTEGENMPVIDKDLDIEDVICSKCNQNMEMEEAEEEFFSWIFE